MNQIRACEYSSLDLSSVSTSDYAKACKDGVQKQASAQVCSGVGPARPKGREDELRTATTSRSDDAKA